MNALVRHSATVGKLVAALARAQAKFGSIGKDKAASVFSKRTGATFTYAYADLSTCIDAIRPALNAEGIVLFQFLSVRAHDNPAGTWVIATTRLALEDEWIESDYASPVIDPTDPRALGSAGTYARRYGMLGTVGVFPEAEDDDGQAARGGDHPVAAPASAPPCPACGVIGSLMKGSAQYGGGSVCWTKKGGCGAKWPEGSPFPPTMPPGGEFRAPQERPQSVAVREEIPRRVDDSRTRAAAESASLVGAPSRVIGAVVDALAPPGLEDCEVSGCWGGRNHPGAHVFDAVTTFTIGKSVITTAGMNREQFEESHRLATALDKKFGKATARGILAALLGVPVEAATRKDLTEARAEEYLTLLRQAAEAVMP